MLYNEIKHVLPEFAFEGKYMSVEELHSGNINRTFHLRYLAGGRYELGEAAPVHPGLLLGTGLFLSAGVGLVSLLLTGNPLRSLLIDLHVPLLGEVHFVTSLFFDLGVFLVVVGLVLDILRSLGAEIDRQGELAGQDVGPGAATVHGGGS